MRHSCTVFQLTLIAKASFQLPFATQLKVPVARVSFCFLFSYCNNFSGHVPECPASIQVTFYTKGNNQIIDPAIRSSLSELSLPQNSLVRFCNS
jgi:hypothetical protein